MKKYTETVEQKEEIIDNYVNKKWGLLKSGAEFGFSKNLTKRILVENGIKIRNNSEAHRVYSLHEEYFNYESHNMAYILGFIAADGTVREKSNEIKITLSSVDKELLEKISSAEVSVAKARHNPDTIKSTLLNIYNSILNEK